MKPSSWDKQLGLASPRQRTANQSDQTNTPSKNDVGLDVSHHARISQRGGGMLFSLTSFFLARHSRNQNTSVSFQHQPLAISFSQKPHRSRILKSYSSSGTGLTQDLTKAFPIHVSLQVHSKTQ